MKLAQRLSAFKPSATGEVFRRVAELRAQGVKLVSLAIGEPDFDPPLHIRQAAQRALETGPYGYTQVAGLPELRAAICADSRARRGVGGSYTVDQVVVSAGAKHALYNLAHALYDPGDEVIIPTPSWVSYSEQARMAGATPVLVPCGPEHDFLLTPEALERAISERSKALVLCSPNNPTGTAYGERELTALAEVVRRHPQLWVIVDEIYAELCYDGFVAPSLAQVAPELNERLVIVDGVSKTHAMTGFRVGWSLSPKALARACETLQSQTTTSVSTPAQLAALAALSGDKRHVAEMVEQYRQRRDRLIEGLSGLPDVRWVVPRGAFYVFADVRGWLGRKARGELLSDDIAVATWLLEHARLAVVPGTAFGTPGFLRLSFAASLGEIDAAIACLGVLASAFEG
ncbi:MAG TPA: pyridoxal phosphate-dependent aminotransferase [Polyangiales bacterium]|nr:pyridoxal phosphate-dependent aminotransferase [Polyangiales bacterium]